MKIAIFHNYFDNIGGAEIVTLIMARELDADIYTTVCDVDMIDKMGFDAKRIHTIGWVPKKAPFRQQLTQIRFRFLDLKNKYDAYIISGDWASSGVVLNKPSIWYLYGPQREIWDLSEYTRKNYVPSLLRPIFSIWVMCNRNFMKSYSEKANKIIVISKNVQKRVKNYFNLDASIIYPPVDTKDFHFSSYGDYWLCVSRLINHKRLEIQIEVFRKMPKEKLIIVGSYERGAGHFDSYARKILGNLPKNIKVKSWVDKDELVDLYANAKGIIATAIDEDFGLSPVEGMASGKPIVAPNEGGYKETVIDGKTGLLMDSFSTDEIIRTISHINSRVSSFRILCQKRAKEFDTDKFIRKIRGEISKL